MWFERRQRLLAVSSWYGKKSLGVERLHTISWIQAKANSLVEEMESKHDLRINDWEWCTKFWTQFINKNFGGFFG